MSIDTLTWLNTTDYGGELGPQLIDDRQMARRLACMKGGASARIARHYYAKYMNLKSQQKTAQEGPSPREIMAQAKAQDNVALQRLKTAARQLLQVTPDGPEWQKLAALV